MTGPPSARTAAAIAAIQLPSGSIPWEKGRHSDPWNHVEAAMGLTVAGQHGAAERAYRWLADLQRPDGSWASAYLEDEVMDGTVDANFCAYIAAGAWLHFLATSSFDHLRMLWPTVEAAIDLVLGLRLPDGAIMWARDPEGEPWPGALITSSSCIHLSIGCALEIGRALGKERPDWQEARRELGSAVAAGGPSFEAKDGFAMDWYYPVLGGVLTGDEGRSRLLARWDEFVIPGWGVLCVKERRWCTTGETSELILACCRAGMREEALRLWSWMQRLRDDGGLYWTGANHPSGDTWPPERTTWSAAAVLLAADALFGTGATSRFFTAVT